MNNTHTIIKDIICCKSRKIPFTTSLSSLLIVKDGNYIVKIYADIFTYIVWKGIPYSLAIQNWRYWESFCDLHNSAK